MEERAEIQEIFELSKLGKAYLYRGNRYEGQTSQGKSERGESLA